MAEASTDSDGVAKAISGLQLGSSGRTNEGTSSSVFSLAANAEKNSLSEVSPSASNMKAVAISGPTISNGAKVWNITEKFTRAAAALSTGKLIKDESFTLFESVGAIEIMDPKMDSGYLRPGESLEYDYDPLRPLLPEEVIGIMDQLLCHEMAWHHGYPLAQTLFTSIYVDKLLWPDPRGFNDCQFYRGIRPANLDPLVDVLRAYCVGLIKYCDFVVEKVASRDFYEEEDFSTHTYNRQLLTNTSEEPVISTLRQAIQQVSQLGQSETNQRISQEQINAISVRLELRASILQVSSPDASLSEISGLWQKIRTLLQKLRDTHSLGRPVPEAFSSKIQRRLASTVPPRPIVEFTFEDTLNKYTELSIDCEEAIRICDIEFATPHMLMAFAWAFNCRKPEPLAYSRAWFSSWFMERSNEDFEKFLREDLEELVFPQEIVMDPINWTIEEPRNPLIPKDRRLLMAEIITDFTAKTVPYYYDIWNSLCQNRCRTRRLMCNNIQNWNSLQELTEPLDEDLHELAPDVLEYPLSRWILHHKLQQMEWIVLLGFEQDVYLPDELAGMYWWLRQISLERVALLKALHDFFKLRYESLKAGKKSTKAETVQQTVLLVEAMLWEARGTEALADALHIYYLHLNNVGLLPTLERPYADSALRYELRMKPFLSMSVPQIPPFETYQAANDPATTKEIDLQAAETSVKDAKDAWNHLKRLGAKSARTDIVETVWTKQVSNTLLSCVATGVSIAALRQLQGKTDVAEVKGRKAELPPIDKRYQSWWIVPKIIEV